MEFIAEIDIMPHKELLDPQGKAVLSGLQKMDLNMVQDVRVGKHISLKLQASDEAQAKELVEQACKKLLANAIMEGYTVHIKAI
ncbi:MAG: phosphoribosylformylglycinamidine synthase subunit PurS [Bacteroidota bacterium]